MRGTIGMTLAATVMMMSLTGCGDGNYRRGLAAYQRGDYTGAAAELQPVAERGHAAAQFTLGVMYENGQGVARDVRQAAGWHRLAAEHNLGMMYLLGRGLEQNDAEAARWFTRAADQHHANAQYALASILHEGRGVETDPVAAAPPTGAGPTPLRPSSSPASKSARRTT